MKCEVKPMPGPAGARPQRIGRLGMALTVAVFVLVGHGWSLDTGLFLDDHAHFAHLRDYDWSLRSAIDSATLGIVGDIMDLWGRIHQGLHFFRPIAFWTMKLEYTLGGWQAWPMHVFSLAWHFGVCMLVGALAFRCFGRREWATVAACLMAVHPAHVATVYWVACQTELMVSVYLLVGLLAYARHACWGGVGVYARPWLTRPPGLPFGPDPGMPARGLYAVVAAICFALALGCRENAVFFPLVCFAGDWLIGTPRRRRVRAEHLALAAVLVAYIFTRLYLLAGFVLPGPPYLMRVSDPEFPLFVAQKVLYYTIGLFAYVPVVPMAGQSFFGERTGWFIALFAAVIGLLIAAWVGYRWRKALVWPAVWIALLVAPTMAVFASSHHLYLPSVGAVLLLTAGLAFIGGLFKDLSGIPLPRWQRATTTVLLLVHAVGLGVVTWACGFAYRGGTRSEDILIADVLKRGRPLKDGDHLYFLNIPMLAYYAIPAIEARTGLRGLRGHVLTFSPDLMRMESPAHLEVLDEHRIRVRAPKGRAYFEGVSGKSLITAMSFESYPVAGVPIHNDETGLTILPTVVDEKGIRELEFTFTKPLSAPDCHLFFGSPRFLAYPINVQRMTRTAPVSSAPVR
jgi:hypothetical protein